MTDLPTQDTDTGRPPALAVIVVNYGSHELLASNLADRDLTAVPARVIVVDNYSDERELQAIRQLSDEQGWPLVESPENVGFGAGVALGVTAAQELGLTDFLFLNPDVAVPDQVLREMLCDLRSAPSTAISPVIVTEQGKAWFRGGELDLRNGSVRTSRPADMRVPFAWLTGACLGVTDELWRKADGFAPDYFLYWEDVDFSRRCVVAGGSLRVRDDLTVVHAVGATQGTGKSAIYMYYNTRNRLLFGGRWLPPRVRLRWLIHTPAQSLAILRRSGTGWYRRRDLMAAAARGTGAGIRDLLTGR